MLRKILLAGACAVIASQANATSLVTINFSASYALHNSHGGTPFTAFTYDAANPIVSAYINWTSSADAQYFVGTGGAYAATATSTLRVGAPGGTIQQVLTSNVTGTCAANAFCDIEGGNTGHYDFTQSDITNVLYSKLPFLLLDGETSIDPGASISSGRLSGYFSTLSGTLNVTFGGPSAVPEPASWGLMLMGFAAVGASMRRVHRRVSFNG